MKKVIVFVGVALIVIGLVVIRLVQLLPYPQGEGTGADSPDGKYCADVFVMTDKTFLGKTIRYYGLEITESSTSIEIGEEVRILYDETVAIAPGEKPLDLGDLDVDSLIRWSPDSKSVIFSIGNRQVKAIVPE